MKTITLPDSIVHTGSLILVNGQYPYYEELSKIKLIAVEGGNNSHRIEAKAATQLAALMNAIQGWSQIVTVSGWRSKQEQEEIWKESLQENGLEFTKKFVAIPGHSEHQTGLAMDLGLKKEEIDFICPEFPYEGICQIFRDHTAEFGFVERYPKGKESITGIGHEPWHFRYVGTPHASIMKQFAFTLEEYIQWIKQFTYGVKGYSYQMDQRMVRVSFLPVSTKEVSFELEEGTSYTVSGNNVNGIILTEWREQND